MNKEEIGDLYYELLLTEGTIDELKDAKMHHFKAGDYALVQVIQARIDELLKPIVKGRYLRIPVWYDKEREIMYGRNSFYDALVMIIAPIHTLFSKDGGLWIDFE